MRVTERHLEPLNQRFQSASPVEILRFAREVFGDRVAILSSMQRAGTALCHLADRAGLAFDVLFVDTGVLHAETLQTRDALAASHPHLRVITLSPERTMADRDRRRGRALPEPRGAGALLRAAQDGALARRARPLQRARRRPPP
ncbi:MAG: phosphoadenosine phosphosulfate reductase family protein [Minicystis sp.]